MSETIALWFLFFAYTAVFTLIFVYVGRAHSRTRQIEASIKRLEESLDDEGDESTRA